MSNQELVRMQVHHNDWYVRHARRLLQERWASGRNMSAVIGELQGIFRSQPDVPRKLRALWALHVIDGLEDDFLIRLLDHDSEYVRAWSVRLLCEDREPLQAALHRFKLLAADGDSPLVRLHLASALQRLPLAQRWEIAEALVARSEDVNDVNLPLMNWYAIEPLVDDNLHQAVELANLAKIPLIPKTHCSANRIAIVP